MYSYLYNDIQTAFLKQQKLKEEIKSLKNVIVEKDKEISNFKLQQNEHECRLAIISALSKKVEDAVS